MVDRDSAAPLQAPFDQGVFLLHYNRGREAFQEGRFAEARRDLEHAQKLRPDDSDVLNLLGLILFKQGKLEDAEEFLLRSVELRPNYAKSHLYLGLLYRQRRKYGLALEHLKFAGADKLVREVEAEVKQVIVNAPIAAANAEAKKDSKFTTAKIPAVKPPTKPDVRTQPAIAPAPDRVKTLVP